MKKIVTLLILLPVYLYSFSDSSSNISVYNKGLGGAHTGMAYGFNTFFNNPALFSLYEEDVSFFRFGTNIKGDTLDILNMYLGNELSLENPALILSKLKEKELDSLLVGLNLSGPINIGKISRNWGWELSNISDLFIKLPSIASNAEVIIREDVMFSLGVSFPFKVMFGDSFFIEFSPGIMSRTTFRGEVNIDSGLLDIFNYAKDINNLLSVYPVKFSPLFAVDLGYMINIYNLFTLSGVIKDLYTPILKYNATSLDDVVAVFTKSSQTVGSLLYREINIGLAINIPRGPLSVVVSDIDFYFDYFDLLQFERNILLHLGAGLDVELLNKIHLLGGLNQGLLSLGLNVDVGSLEVGFSMYGTEEGTEPGSNSVFNFILSVGISL